MVRMRASRKTVRDITELDVNLALDECNGNRAEAAYLLSISVKTLTKLQTKYNIKSTAYRVSNEKNTKD